MALDKLNSRRYREQRERVFKRDGRFCQLCGTDEGEMHIDHVIPRKSGGGHELDNLRVLCKSCNLRKGCLLYTSPSPRDRQKSRMPSSA